MANLNPNFSLQLFLFDANISSYLKVSNYCPFQFLEHYLAYKYNKILL